MNTRPDGKGAVEILKKRNLRSRRKGLTLTFTTKSLKDKQAHNSWPNTPPN